MRFLISHHDPLTKSMRERGIILKQFSSEIGVLTLVFVSKSSKYIVHSLLLLHTANAQPMPRQIKKISLFGASSSMREDDHSHCSGLRSCDTGRYRGKESTTLHTTRSSVQKGRKVSTTAQLMWYRLVAMQLGCALQVGSQPLCKEKGGRKTNYGPYDYAANYVIEIYRFSPLSLTVQLREIIVAYHWGGSVVLVILWGCRNSADWAAPVEILYHQVPMPAGGNHPGATGSQMSTMDLIMEWDVLCTDIKLPLLRNTTWSMNYSLFNGPRLPWPDLIFFQQWVQIIWFTKLFQSC